MDIKCQNCLKTNIIWKQPYKVFYAVRYCLETNFCFGLCLLLKNNYLILFTCLSKTTMINKKINIIFKRWLTHCSPEFFKKFQKTRQSFFLNLKNILSFSKKSNLVSVRGNPMISNTGRYKTKVRVATHFLKTNSRISNFIHGFPKQNVSYSFVI